MKPYPMCTVRFYNYRNVCLRLLIVISAFVLLLLLTSSKMYSQCNDYCSQGYAILDLKNADSLCFTIPSGGSAKVCLEGALQYQGGAGCSDTAQVDVAIWKRGTLVLAAPQNCVSPLHYQFIAGDGLGSGTCPNGEAQCCCLEPGDYYVKILHYAANFAYCMSGIVKVCISCNDPNCN